MRILLACEFYHPSVGGVQEVMRQLAERFAGRGHDVTVVTSYLPERATRTLNGVTIVEFKVAGNRVRGFSGDAHEYREFVLRGDYDIFMVKAAQQWTFDALWPVLDQLRRPIVFVPCGFSGLHDPAYAGYFREMPQILRAFDHLVFYASDYRDINFARSTGLSSFTVLSNAASEVEFGVPRDPSFRRRHGIPDDAFVILTVGTFTGGLKGHRELAEAFDLAEFDGRPATLVLNGNVMSSGMAPGRWPRRAVRAVRRLAHRARVAWSTSQLPPGQAPRTIASIVSRINRGGRSKQAMIADLARPELVQAYLNSDLFVFASNIEYSPLVLFEAAAAGLPFLTVPVGNAAEIAGWTGGGVVCPAPTDAQGYTRVDPAVLGAHITRLAADTRLLESLGAEGQRRWAEQFTWAIVAGRYETLFTRLVEERQVTHVQA